MSGELDLLAYHSVLSTNVKGFTFLIVPSFPKQSIKVISVFVTGRSRDGPPGVGVSSVSLVKRIFKVT
jgi:hypothetical protein